MTTNTVKFLSFAVLMGCYGQGQGIGARIFTRGVTWMCDVYVYMHKHVRLGGSEGMLPQGIFFFFFF